MFKIYSQKKPNLRWTIKYKNNLPLDDVVLFFLPNANIMCLVTTLNEECFQTSTIVFNRWHARNFMQIINEFSITQ